MIADATIEIRDSRMNGYHSGALDDENVVMHEAEILVSDPPFQPAHKEETGPSVGRTNTEVAARPQPTPGAAENVKPTQKKANVKSSRKAKAGCGTAAAKTPPSKPGITYVPQSALDRDLEKLETLSRASLAGDTTALDELRTALDRCPHVWRRLSDIEHLVELKLMALVAGNDPLRSEAFRKRCSELRHHLLAGEPSSLATKMAASRLTITWLFVQFLELRTLESPDRLHSIKQLEQAERRYQVAMRTYGLARHLDLQLQRLAQPCK
jgi:hypothetical protein